MTYLYFCDKDDRDRFAALKLSLCAGRKCSLLRTAAGKPYTDADGVFVSLSHSDNLCAVAISSFPVGVDTEVLQGKKYKALFKSFSLREQSEIKSQSDFLVHWTAREAYVKMLGKGIWQYVKRLEFFEGSIYLDGNREPENIFICRKRGAITAICCKDENFILKN